MSKSRNLTGLVVTGAPVETLEFQEVDFWEELTQILDWAKTNVFSSMFICWGAQAGLYHYYGIPKYPLPDKIFGVFPHFSTSKFVPLFRGFDDEFYAPHSRHTEVRREDIEKMKQLQILSESPEAGIYIVISRDNKEIFITGHSEYEAITLKAEYDRDVSKNLLIALPKNYFPGDDPSKDPLVKWRGHANLLFANWLNYYVYQETPYDINAIGK